MGWIEDMQRADGRVRLFEFRGPQGVVPVHRFFEFEQTLFVLVTFNDHALHFDSSETLPIGRRYIFLRETNRAVQSVSQFNRKKQCETMCIG